MPGLSIDTILEATRSTRDEVLVEDFDFETSKENQLMFFFKPECFLIEHDYGKRTLIEMVLERFKEYSVDVSGALLLGGKRIEELGVVDRHYGLINRLSKEASALIKKQERDHLYDRLEVDEVDSCAILGGHEFLQRFPSFNPQQLDDFWSSKKSEKVRSGFYVQLYNVDGEDIILVNGFHPLQLNHYTNPEHNIVVLLLNSDVDWRVLKHELVGNTFPEKAHPNSIRGELYRNRDKYCIDAISIANNYVHLSAGPFEAMFEMDNFLANLCVVEFELIATNMARLMLEKGIMRSNIERYLSNPLAQIDGEGVDLFTYTEEKKSSEAIADYINYFLNHA